MMLTCSDLIKDKLQEIRKVPAPPDRQNVSNRSDSEIIYIALSEYKNKLIK